MSAVHSLFARLIGPIIRRRCRVRVGQRTRLNWWALRSTRGGNLDLGPDSVIHCRVAFDSPDGAVQIGQRCYIGSSLLVCHTGITLGDDVIISWGVTIVDHDSHTLDWGGRNRDVVDWMQGRKDWSRVAIQPVQIEDKVWIGFGASILKGVRIGEGAVVAAKSVVTRDVPPYSLVAGNPARVIREIPRD